MNENEMGYAPDCLVFHTPHIEGNPEAGWWERIAEAARKLERNIKTIHLSDFKAGRSHVFIGEGKLDFQNFFNIIDREAISAITLECSLISPDHPNHEMNYNELVNRMKQARLRLEHLLGFKG